MAESFIPIWKRDLNISLSESQLTPTFSLALENFFQQSTEKQLTYEWLSQYFAEIKRTILALVNA